MAEEVKKEEVKKEESVPKEEPVQKEQQEPKAEIKAEKPKEDVKPPSAAKPAAEEKKTEGRIKAGNCAQCNKVLKHRMWYYRNGKFYCNKGCWKKSTEKAA